MDFRNRIYEYVKNIYGVEKEHLWFKFPGYAVFRRKDSGKWFGIIMDIHASKLGLDNNAFVDVLNVKVDDFAVRDVLLTQKGFFKGYHMGHNWVSILLDGSVPEKQIYQLIDESYEAVGKKYKTKNWHGVSFFLVLPAGLEPATSWFEAKRSIQLSYESKCVLRYLK